MFSKKVRLKRYTPPTCTLEIWARESLWLWSGAQSPYQDLSFELHFDDPRWSEEQQVILEGEQSDLELLSDLVNEYVHYFLGHSRGGRRQFEGGRRLGLANRGLLTHELLFGNLGASKPSVLLSASQLLDLVDVLEQYQLEIQTLINKAPDSRKKTSLILWFSSAILVLSILGIYQWKRMDKTTSESQIAQQRQKNLLSAKILPVIPPAPSPNTRPPVPSPILPLALSNRKTLPSPSAVVVPSLTPSPTSNIPPTSLNTSVQSKSNEITVQPISTPPNIDLPAAPPLVSPNQTTPEKRQSLNIDPTRTDALDNSPLVTPSSIGSTKTEKKSSSLLDIIPQVQEVREYFQQRWKVPEGLTQRLEYRLQFNPQGSITQIIPLGKAANIYLDKTSMPLLNAPFVSPLPSKEPATIRLVLLPDGTVKTFLE